MTLSEPIVREIHEFLKSCLDCPIGDDAPTAYILGLWVEHEFNAKRGLCLPWQMLHTITETWCDAQGIT